MTLFGSKKGYSKNDINFFEEFTASARKQTQVLAVVVFIGIIAIGLCLAVLVYDIFRNVSVQKDIDNLNETLASEEYAGLELRSQALQQEINDRNKYYYTLTEMRRIIDQTYAASTDVVNIIGESIPSDAYVTDYMLTGTSLTMQGLTFSYYDAANIAHLLNEAEVFSNYVTPTIQRNEEYSYEVSPEENPIDVYYAFSVSGNLINDAVISISHMASTETGVIALSGVQSQIVEAGTTYEFTGVTSYSVNGVNYTLSSVSINGQTISDADFAMVTNNDKISGVASGNVEINLYYTVAVAETAEEGSAE